MRFVASLVAGVALLGPFAGAQVTTTAPTPNKPPASAPSSATGLRVVLDRTFPPETTWAAYSRDGTRIMTISGRPYRGVAAGTAAGVVAVWDAATGSRLISIDPIEPIFLIADFSPDGRRFIIQHAEFASVWDTTTGAPVFKLPNVASQWGNPRVQYSPEGSRILTASGDKDHNGFRIWDSASGQLIASLAEDRLAQQPTFSPDGKHVAFGGGEGLSILDLATGAQVLWKPTPPYNPGRFEYSPDGKRIILTDDVSTVPVIDASSGAVVSRFSGHDYVIAVAFTPDGRRIATSDSSYVRIWDADSRKLLARFRSSYVDRITFAPDGEHLLTSSSYVNQEKANIWRIEPN